MVGNILGISGPRDDRGAAERAGWRFIRDSGFAEGGMFFVGSWSFGGAGPSECRYSVRVPVSKGSLRAWRALSLTASLCSEGRGWA